MCPRGVLAASACGWRNAPPRTGRQGLCPLIGRPAFAWWPALIEVGTTGMVAAIAVLAAFALHLAGPGGAGGIAAVGVAMVWYLLGGRGGEPVR